MSFEFGSYSRPKCGSQKLKSDQACLEFIIPSDWESKLSFSAQSSECYQCPNFLIKDKLTNGTLIPVNTTFPPSEYTAFFTTLRSRISVQYGIIV